MKILVTGGGGFIGRALIPCLIKAGHDVIASSRALGTVLPGTTVRQVGALGPDTDWSAALEGIDAIVHLAARVHVMNERAADPVAENIRINAEGTAALASQAAQAGVKHFIFLSTIKVHGEATPGAPFRADDTPHPLDPYAIAKLQAEQALLEIAAEGAMRVDIIRPPLVYGPGVRGNFLSLLKLCTKNWPLPLASINNRRSLIYSGNLAALISHILTRTDTPGGIYLCKDGQDVATPALFRQVSEALGGTLRIFPLPLFLLRLGATLVGKSATITRLTESLVVDDQPTRTVLDWTPPFSMIQGLKETADWFNSQP